VIPEIRMVRALIQCAKCGCQRWDEELYETERGPHCDKCWAPNDPAFPKGLKHDVDYYYKRKWQIALPASR
jgi:NAD-dependent SIR2 family protein deacetylase